MAGICVGKQRAAGIECDRQLEREEPLGAVGGTAIEPRGGEATHDTERFERADFPGLGW